MRKLLFAIIIVTIPIISIAGDAPPVDFMNLEVGVLRQYGSTSGYGFKLKQLIAALGKTGGKEVWKKESEGNWSYSLTINDNATNSTQRMAFVFQKDKNFASIIRYVDNEKEIKSQFLGSAVDQLLVPIGQSIGAEKSTSKSAAGKKPTSISKSALAGTYGDDQYKVTLDHKAGTFRVNLAGRCMDRDSNIKAISLSADGIKFKRGEDDFEEVASLEVQECKLSLTAVNNNGVRELRITEDNNCCQNLLSNLLIKNK